MKKLLLLILLFGSLMSSAQNYQCLQSGVLHYFINGNGYLRAIKIDSITTLPDTAIFYPFHTPRGSYIDTPYITPTLDTNGGSWLGKKVLQLTDGSFIFDNYWGNAVTIKSHAMVGDNWILYSDSSSLYYKAQVTSIDTMNVLGVPDSIKRILITAHNPSGIMTADPLDSMEILLSKNHGFVQVLDLYTFPYHKPDSSYRVGLDFFLDRSTLHYNQIGGYSGYAPDKNITLFKLVDFINPNDVQLHSWNVGDITERDHQLGMFWYSCTDNYSIDTIVSKTVSPHQISYWQVGSRFSKNPPSPQTFVSANTTFYDTNYSIVEFGHIPEHQFNTGRYVFYFPDDTSSCRHSPAYWVRPGGYFIGGLGGSWQMYIYKLGIGMTIYDYSDGDPTYETDDIIYSNSAGIKCGHMTWPLFVEDINTAVSAITIAPNPATDQLSITASGTIYQITITNVLGQQIFCNNYNSLSAHIDISDLRPGLYFARINGVIVKNFIKQ